MSEQQGIPQGDPTWVESCMTKEEYMHCYKVLKYNTLTGDWDQSMDYTKSPKWRVGMGSSFSTKEIKIVNDRIDKLREFLKSKL